MNSDKFFNELGNVPSMNEELYDRIESKILDKKTKWHKIYMLAASIILVFGITFYNVKDNFNTVSSSVVISDEVVEELQIIDDYLNGLNIDEEIEMYAFSSIY